MILTRLQSLFPAKWLFAVILFVVSSVAAFAVATLVNHPNPVVDNNNAQTPTEEQPLATPDPLAPYNILIMGHGGPMHDGGRRTDTMILANIDPREKEIKLLSIPRDLWVSLPIAADKSSDQKINGAFLIGSNDDDYPDKPVQFTGEHGGGEMAKYAVEMITGEQIKYYVAVNFDGFKQIIDTLGGITVNVPHTFDDYFYPLEDKKTDPCGRSEEDIAALTATMSGFLLEQQFPCRYEHLHFDQGSVTMDAETALKFVRSRHSETHGNDFSRSQRQHALIQALKDKVISVNFIPKIIPTLAILRNNISTDIGPGAVTSILTSHGDFRDYTIESYQLSLDNVLEESRSSDRQYILTPKDNSWYFVHQFVRESFYVEDKTATESATLIDAQE